MFDGDGVCTARKQVRGSRLVFLVSGKSGRFSLVHDLSRSREEQEANCRGESAGMFCAALTPPSIIVVRNLLYTEL